MEINITIKGIEQFTEAVALLASAIAYDKGIRRTGEAAKEIVTSATTPETTQEPQVKEDKPIATEEASTLTIEDVRAAFMAKNTKNNTPKLKAILKDHGVKKVTDLEEKDFNSVMKALEEI